MKFFSFTSIIVMNLLIATQQAVSGVILDEYLVKENGVPRIIRYELGTMLRGSKLPFLLVYQVGDTTPLYHLQNVEVDIDDSSIKATHHNGALLHYELVERTASMEKVKNAILQRKLNPKGFYYRFSGGVHGLNEIHLEYNHMDYASSGHQRNYCTECLSFTGKYTIKSKYYDSMMNKLLYMVFGDERFSTWASLQAENLLRMFIPNL